MRTLNIAKGILLPLDIVTQTVAILAKRRVGKSYTMRRIAEQLLENNQQVVIVDPKGDQWGIRSSADGKKPGYPMIILGGEHGDAPLEVNSGEMVAKMVVEQRFSMLLDLSLFRKGEVATFMAIFLENLYRLKAQEKYRTPLMLIIDEADAIAPQKPQKGEERMLGAANDIVRRGGQRGLGCILVTQRSAVLNKNVLTQSEMLIVLRTISPQDLAAMNAWIDVHGEPEQKKILMESLPSLPIGDAWFWSPGWPTAEGIFKRVHILPITTFDSAATPKAGEKKITPKNLADVDLEVLKKQMADTIEKAKQEDPKLLKKKILELETEINKLKKFPLVSAPDPDVVTKAVAERIGANNREWEKIIGSWRTYAEKVEKYYKDLVHEGQRHFDIIASHKPVIDHPEQSPIFYPKYLKKTETSKIPEKPVNIRVEQKKEPLVNSSIQEGDVVINGGARKMLEVLASRFPMKLTWVQIATFSKLKSSTGSYSTNKSNLRRAGMIVEEGDLVSASQAGLDYIGTVPKAPQSSTELLDMWASSLPGGASKMFDYLRSVYPMFISRTDLAEAVGLIPTTGSYSTNLSILRTNNLIEENGVELKLSDNLFM